MSFDLFVGCFRNGETAQFPRSLVDGPFEAYVSRREPNCLTLSFANGGQSCVFREDSNEISSFNVNRPAAASELYVALFTIMRSATLALYMPGNCPPLIARAEVAAHLPKSMVEKLGTPVVLQSPQEI